VFTGVIHHFGKVEKCAKSGDLRVTISHDFPDKLRIGDSVSCNGACLTVVDEKPGIFAADISDETLRCTAPRWEAGNRLHLERALRLSDSLDGHLVTGHVDGLAKIINISKGGDSHRLSLEAPAEFAKFIAAKGSVTLDGVSLTVNEVTRSNFTVNIIPHTWQVTTFRERLVGDMLNLEIDLIARYTARLLGK
jgi:riboflavin synthase